MVDTAKGRENFLDNASADDVSDEALEDITDKDLRHGSAVTNEDEDDAGAFELAQEMYECLLAAAADDMDLESAEATRLLGQWIEAERALPPLPGHLVYSIADVKTKCQ